MRAASFLRAFVQRASLTLGDLPLDLLSQWFTPAAGSEIPFQLLIPRPFFHTLEPTSELPPFLFRQMLDGLLDGLDTQYRII
jgi:hypothetical protein